MSSLIPTLQKCWKPCPNQVVETELMPCPTRLSRHLKMAYLNKYLNNPPTELQLVHQHGEWSWLLGPSSQDKDIYVLTTCCQTVPRCRDFYKITSVEIPAPFAPPSPQASSSNITLKVTEITGAAAAAIKGVTQ